MDIRKPEFMKQAITSKSHGIVFQLLVTVALYFVGSIVGMIIQFPATMIYLFRDKEYLRMITTMDINMDKMVEIVSNQPAWMTIVSLIYNTLQAAKKNRK